jgi:hypothetical protein
VPDSVRTKTTASQPCDSNKISFLLTLYWWNNPHQCTDKSKIISVSNLTFMLLLPVIRNVSTTTRQEHMLAPLLFSKTRFCFLGLPPCTGHGRDFLTELYVKLFQKCLSHHSCGLHPEDRGSIVLWNTGILHITTQCRIPEDCNKDLHWYGNLKSHYFLNNSNIAHFIGIRIVNWSLHSSL